MAFGCQCMTMDDKDSTLRILLHYYIVLIFLLHPDGPVEITGQVTAHLQHILIDGLRLLPILHKVVLLSRYIMLVSSANIFL